jgi:hypothetical protein
MKRLITFALGFGLLGCGQREQQSAVVVAQTSTAEGSADATKNPIPDPQPGQTADTKRNADSQPLKPPEPSPGFEYPADLTGKAVVKAVAPETPALTPTERFGTAPKPRPVPAKITNPESIVKANYMPPPLLLAKSNGVAISPPREQVPFDLGRGADAIPTKPTLPIAAAITERARDVNLPPVMPILGRPLNDRVSIDDPTSEFANAAIVSPTVKVPLASAEFVKVDLPDPFELAEQVKTKVPPPAEPGLKPVVVDPQRVK